MKSHENKRVKSVIAVLILATGLFVLAGCGGGSITFTPGTGVPGTGNNPAPAKSPAVAANLVYAGVDIFTPSMVIRGQAGAAAPFAQINYISHTGVATSGPAGADGSFEIKNFPNNFDFTSGAPVTLTQVAPNMTESDPVTITFN